ncbi:MAG: sigma 54-interacting transcriptional regulator [Polyangiales bacterium]
MSKIGDLLFGGQGAVREESAAVLDARDRERWGALDALPSPVAVTGPDGVVCWTNAAWTHQSRERWTRPVEAAGAHYLAVCRQGMGLSRDDLETVGAGLRAVLAGQRATFEHEFACHPAGAEAWYTVSVTPCTTDGRRGVMVQHTDVTDLRQADRRRTVARAVARAMEREEGRREMLQGVVATVCDAMGWCLAATWTWDHATGVLRCDGVQPRSLTATYGWSAVTTAAGIAARVWGDHEPRWFDEIDREDASVMRTALGAQSDRVREAVGVPVGRDGHVDGVVVFYSAHTHRPEPALLKLLAMLFTGARWSPASIADARPAATQDREDDRAGQRSFASIAAQSMAPALIRGERGTGKARLAREVHARGERARGPYVECNCASLKAAAFEDELFGHEAGAVPGASRARRGLLEEASGGTLVLRDVGSLDALSQVRLLKALESRSIRRIGGAREIRFDARVIATTSADLSAASAAGDFDSDLLRHLSAIVVEVAPLRDREGEFDELARRVADDVARSYNRPAPELPADTLGALRAHRWPGNVRELRNVIERAWLGVGAEVSAASVVAALASLQAKAANDTAPTRARAPRPRAAAPAPVAAPVAQPVVAPAPVAAPAPIAVPSALLAANAVELADPSDLTLSAFERAHIERVLKHTNFNMRRAAQVLGISRSTLYLRAKDYKLDLGTSRRSGRVEVDEFAANDTDLDQDNEQDNEHEGEKAEQAAASEPAPALHATGT